MDWITSPEAWIALVTLTALEIVLGIDNIIFISILVGRLPADQRSRARVLGLGLAMITRILLLLSITWVMRLTTPLFSIAGREVSGRDLILIAGGLFLLWKATKEIHHRVDVNHAPDMFDVGRGALTFGAVVGQIVMLDIVFSVDSIITAVGMVDRIAVMVAAVVASVALMMAFAGAIGRFVSSHPTVKMLALAFLFVIGVVLIADGFDHHVPKGYVYFAMAFSVAVEALNIRMRKRRSAPVELRAPYARDGE